MALKVGINGFGRIGRNIYRAAWALKPDFEIVAVNDIGDAKTFAHLLKHDTALGTFEPAVKAEGEAIQVDGHQVKFMTQKDPAELPWRDLGVDLVVESTGLFTGANKAVAEVLPELAGKFAGISFRVPILDVSVVDLTVRLGKTTTAEEINAAFEEAASGELRGILAVSREELVSSDFKNDPHSSIVDAPSTAVLTGVWAKVVSWYDNEWGFSCRMVDLISYMAQRL